MTQVETAVRSHTRAVPEPPSTGDPGTQALAPRAPSEQPASSGTTAASSRVHRLAAAARPLAWSGEKEESVLPRGVTVIAQAVSDRCAAVRNTLGLGTARHRVHCAESGNVDGYAGTEPIAPAALPTPPVRLLVLPGRGRRTHRRRPTSGGPVPQRPRHRGGTRPPACGLPGRRSFTTSLLRDLTLRHAATTTPLRRVAETHLRRGLHPYAPRPCLCREPNTSGTHHDN